MASFHKFGGENCLQKVNMDMIDKLMEEIGDDVLLFVPHDYAEQAQNVFSGLGVPKLTFENVWKIFEHMLPLINA